MIKKFVVVLCLVTGTLSEARAHPVSFKGGFGVMPEYQPKRQELELNYSMSHRAAVGLSTIEVEQEHRDLTFVLPRFNYRLYRQNEIDSQTNVYVYGGIGGVESRDVSGVALLSGLQADYETRRFYTLLLGENIHGEENLDVSRIRYRIGGAPYKAGFDGFHTWLIGQVEYTPDMSDEWTLSPVLRVFYQNYLVEAGSSTKGEFFVSGIFHF